MRALLLVLGVMAVQLEIASAGDDLLELTEGETFGGEFVRRVTSTPASVLDETRDSTGRTMLHLLAWKSHQARIVVPLLVGADPNVRDNRGRTPLFEAFARSVPGDRGKDIMILELLAFRGADLNAKADDGMTPLALAAARGDYRTAEFLLWRGAQLEVANVPAEKRPLTIARAKGDQNMTALLEAAAAADSAGPTVAKSPKRRRRVTDVIDAADLNALDELIASGWNVNEQDDAGYTALFRAANAGCADFVTALLFAGADPNIADNNGWTPLMLTVRSFNFEGQRMTGSLLLKGANVHAVAKGGETALINAVAAGNDFSTLWMIAAGADPAAATPRGSLMKYASHGPTAYLLRGFGLAPEKEEKDTSPLGLMHDAAWRNNVAEVRRHLDAGVPVDAEHNGSRTAMHWAVPNGALEVIDLLLERGANINYRGRHTGSNYLHGLAAVGSSSEGFEHDMRGAARTIEKLIARGADPNAAMNDGTTPLMVAAKEGIKGANTEALIKGGADLNRRNKEGLTALGVARKFGRAEMVAFLQAHGARD